MDPQFGHRSMILFVTNCRRRKAAIAKRVRVYIQQSLASQLQKRDELGRSFRGYGNHGTFSVFSVQRKWVGVTVLNCWSQFKEVMIRKTSLRWSLDGVIHNMMNHSAFSLLSVVQVKVLGDIMVNPMYVFLSFSYLLK